MTEHPTPGGDGCYCTHHPDDPAHGSACYEPAPLVSPPKAGAGEAVAWMSVDGSITIRSDVAEAWKDEFGRTVTPLYAAPKQEAQGVRVTDEMAEAGRAEIARQARHHIWLDQADPEAIFDAMIAAAPNHEARGDGVRVRCPTCNGTGSELADCGNDILDRVVCDNCGGTGNAPPLGGGRAEIVEGEAFPKTLGLIHQAIDGYVNALVAREHGQAAMNHAFEVTCEALGRSPIQEMDARRRSLSNPGGGLS